MDEGVIITTTQDVLCSSSLISGHVCNNHTYHIQELQNQLRGLISTMTTRSRPFQHKNQPASILSGTFQEKNDSHNAL